MNYFWMGGCHALVIAWETVWALVLGFGVSATVQVFVMSRLFGRTNLRTMGLAMGAGAADSSCSYDAAARSAIKQGAALIPAMAFMFASTNLVAELGAVLWFLVFLRWRFLRVDSGRNASDDGHAVANHLETLKSGAH